MNFTEEEKREYERQLEELDEKTLLIQQVTELAEIRNQLELLNSQLASPQNENETRHCMSCDKEIESSNLKSHAVEEHNAPPEFIERLYS
jgi:hypothetical protein